MSTAEAWLLDVGLGAPVALGLAEVDQFATVDATRVARIPAAPAHCRHALVWNGVPLAVLDVATCVGADIPSPGPQQRMALVRFDPRRGVALERRRGALRLFSEPRRVTVRDAMACALPHARLPLLPFSIACFECDGDAVPVLDLARLFREN